MKKNNVTIQVGCNGIEDATKKTVRLIEKMQEAKTLADELATCISEISLEIKL